MLNVGNALYGASHWRLSFMLDCFRGGAPSRLWADFCQYFLLVQFILCRVIQPLALKVCIGLKPEMHLKDDIRPLIPVAAETQVDLQNRSED